MALRNTHTTARASKAETGPCVCTTCGISKMRIIDGAVGGQVAFKDINGRRWQRRKCPDCYKKSQLARRAGEKVQGNAPRVKSQAKRYSVIFAPGVPARKCRSCGNDTANYYYCSACYNIMRSKNDSALFEVEFLYGR